MHNYCLGGLVVFQFYQNYPQRCEKILRDIKNPKTRSKNVSLYSVVSDDKFTLPKYEWRKKPWWLHVTWTKLFLVNALARCTTSNTFVFLTGLEKRDFSFAGPPN